MPKVAINKFTDHSGASSLHTDSADYGDDYNFTKSPDADRNPCDEVTSHSHTTGVPFYAPYWIGDWGIHDHAAPEFTPAYDGRLYIYRTTANGGYATCWAASSADSVFQTEHQCISGVRVQSGFADIGRGFCLFNTASIPDAATVTSVQFKAYYTSVYGQRADGDGMVILTDYDFVYPHIPVVVGDYDKSHYTEVQRYTWNDVPLFQWATVDIDDTTIVNKSGYTKLVFRSVFDVDNTPYEDTYRYGPEFRTQDYESQSDGDLGDWAPLLIVEYS